ncbi:MAG TPA: trehalose-phosphatase [Pseudolabrys sp.]|nr:trehalose-phosphatase [Pseudolabrys sp.]
MMLKHAIHSSARREHVLPTPDELLPLDLKTIALLLDVDGTILDFAPTPREVWVPPSLRETLEILLERTQGAVALVSGRSVSDLDVIFAPLQLPAIGGHGAEFRLVPGDDTECPHLHAIDRTLKRKFAAITRLGKGILAEDKGYSLALHYRLAPDKETEIWEAVAAACDHLPEDAIEILRGKWVIEIKPAGFNKATAVRELMQRTPFEGRRPVFIGDDVTDEFVFPVIPEFSGFSFSVGRPIEGTDGCFEEPEDVRQWLSRTAVARPAAN